MAKKNSLEHGADDTDRFDDPLSPDYAGPTPPFSEAGFAEVVAALEAGPEETPERRATLARADEADFFVQQLLSNRKAIRK